MWQAITAPLDVPEDRDLRLAVITPEARAARMPSGSVAPWLFVEGNNAIEVMVKSPLVASDYPALLGAAIDGMELAQVPEPVAIAATNASAVDAPAGRFLASGAWRIPLLSKR
jgi:hypothetical protein